MSEILDIQEFVLKKTQNRISEEKATSILEHLRLEYPGKSCSEALKILDGFMITPSWLRSIVAINETFFFRHPEHFERLRNWVSLKSNIQDLDVLCAGVSHGQEAYSLAMLLTDVLPAEVVIKIMAIDIDKEAIEAAKLARYSEMEINRTPPVCRALLEKYLCVESTLDSKSYIVTPDIVGKVQFVCGNVFQALLLRYDIIFVRNILIYFEEGARTQLLIKLRDKLKLNGLLFIGGGELFPSRFKPEVSERSTSVLERRTL